MNRKRNNFSVSLLLILFPISYFLFYQIVFAAEVRIDSENREVGIGQQFQIDFVVNTEGESVNAFSGKIVFPGDLLEVKNIIDGNSIINLWIEKPFLGSKSHILYSGITPGGFRGGSGLLFSAVFEAKKGGDGSISIQDVKVLENDGFGTLAEIKIFSSQFNIKEVGLIEEVQFSEIEDAEPPETFWPEIAQNESIFDGKWFVVFATQDKSSGIDKYLIYESRRMKKRIAANEWIEADSPYLLKDQELRSYIYVKAVDKAGNERIAAVEPKYPLKWYENYGNWIIIIIGLIVALAILRLIVLKTKH